MRFPQSNEVNFRTSPVITTEYLYYNNGWYHYCSFRDTRSWSFHHVLQTILSENSGKMKCMRPAGPFSFALSFWCCIFLRALTRAKHLLPSSWQHFTYDVPVWKNVHILYSKTCAHMCAWFPSVRGWHSGSFAYSNAFRDGLTVRQSLWSSVTGFHFFSSNHKLHNSETFLCLCGKIINSDRNISVTKCPVVIAASAVLIITVGMCLFMSFNSLEIYFLFIFLLFLRL